MVFPSRDSADNSSGRGDPSRLVQRGFVTSHPDIGSGEEPRVGVEVGQGSSIDARVPQDTAADRGRPSVGSEVYVLRRADGIPIIVGTVGDDHGGYDETYRIDNPHGSGYVQFEPDGSLTVEADDGTTVELQGGAVIINGGTNPVVTDVETTTDADGHVTSVTTSKNDSIQV